MRAVRRIWGLGISLSIAAAILGLSPGARADDLIDLGTLGGPESESFTTAISGNGSVIVGYSELTPGGPDHAFKYSGGMMTDLGTLGGPDSQPTGISQDGAVIVGFSGTASGPLRAFVYSNGTMTDLGILGGGGGGGSEASAVSADGSVIVGISTAGGGDHAFRYSNGALTDLGVLGGQESFASAVSGNGSVIAGSSSFASGAMFDFHAFAYSGGVMHDLGTLGGATSQATAISLDGSVIAGFSLTNQNTTHAFSYYSGTIRDLGTLGGATSRALAISANGLVIVGSSDLAGNSETHAFAYSAGTMIDLGTLGGNFSEAIGVSADGGVIVGRSLLANQNVDHAFAYENGVMIDLGVLNQGDDSVATTVSADGSVIVGSSGLLGAQEEHAFSTRRVLLSQFLPANISINAQNVAAGIDAAIKANDNLSGFQPLFALSGNDLNRALNQLSGQIADGAFQASETSFAPFLLMLTDTPRNARNEDGVRLWISALGARSGLSGNTALGVESPNAAVTGLAAGIEKQLDDDVLVGSSLAGGRESFSSDGGQGSSDYVIAALYGRYSLLERGYLAAALGYGWHNVRTLRAPAVSGGSDILAGKFDAQSFGGRLEAGYEFSLDDIALTPYAAFSGQTFHAPAHNETAMAGASSFALSYVANDSAAEDTELGAHYSHELMLADAVLTLDATTAWEHELTGRPSFAASFLALPGSEFVVANANPAVDTALLGLGGHTKLGDDVSFSVNGNARVGTGTTIVSAAAELFLRW